MIDNFNAKRKVDAVVGRLRKLTTSELLTIHNIIAQLAAGTVDAQHVAQAQQYIKDCVAALDLSEPKHDYVPESTYIPHSNVAA